MKKKAPAVVVEWSELESLDYDCKNWVHKRKAFATVARFASWFHEQLSSDMPWRQVYINGERYDS